MSESPKSLKMQDLSIRKERLDSLKERLAKYKAADAQIAKREEEFELERVEKEKLAKENEAKLEAERKALAQELQRVAAVPSIVTQPAESQYALPENQPPFSSLPVQPQSLQPQQSQQQSLFSGTSFGYPTMVTEKEAIDWLRNGF